uniref:CW-type domain-containing protein n=1 Tax=Amphiprion ocellaris TaxID=80972 RepID=A0AAQ5Y9L0_AMPOC
MRAALYSVLNSLLQSLVVTEDSEASLAAILQHSIVSSLEQIQKHFDSILSKKGTKILIWNIRRAKDGKTEIDFETDPSDFRLPEIQIEELKKGPRKSGSLRPEHNIPDMHYSLRAYLSILYLKPRTQVILRGRKILTKLVSKRLIHIEHDVYKPHFSKEKVKVTFGLNPKNKDHYGIMMYHKNRLIKAYEKVGCQLKASGQRAGIGVIGIIECNFLKPAHNKQDFEYTKEYRLTLGALGLKLNDYWKEVTEKKAREREFQAVDKDENGGDEGPMWLQCEECLKWRSVPASHYDVTPENWNCSQNPNPRYRSCSSPEEAEDSEELLTPSYQKNHKKLEHPRSRKREKSLEVCEFQEPVTKHQGLSRSSSEPVQPTFQDTNTPEHATTILRRHTEDKTLKHVETNADRLTDHCRDTHTNDAQTQSVTNTEEKPAGSYKSIKDKNETTAGQMLVENEANDQNLGDEECHKKNNVEERMDTLSHKRPSESLLHFVKKKRYLCEDQQPDSRNLPDELHPGKQTDIFKIVSTETNRKDSGDRLENSDTLQQTPSSHTWTHLSASTQTVVVSPLSRTEGSHSRTLPPEAGEREAKVQRLAGLEKEVHRLRSLLGLEITKTTQCTMTSSDSSAEEPKQKAERPSASTANTEVGCQTDMAECSSSSSSSPVQAAGPQGLLAQAQKAVLEPKDQPEQNKTRKNESQSRTKVSDSEDCEDNRSAQQNLRDIRNNVVVLLTALLPQLDLAGISMETTDVDNILQQIIEVNSLKL